MKTSRCREYPGSGASRMSASNRIYVRFRGARGSIPVSGSRYIRRGGNTPCVEVRCLFHHAPERDADALRGIEAAARRMFAGSAATREGLTLSP